ncbi:MAG TPA: hypothetical protein VF526_15470 [Solirubrobacteraceae bacterium]|jgi:hypothetical protein
MAEYTRGEPWRIGPLAGGEAYASHTVALAAGELTPWQWHNLVGVPIIPRVVFLGDSIPEVGDGSVRAE